MTSASLEDDRYAQLEKMCVNPLFWEQFTSSKQGVQIIHVQQDVGKNYLDFGNIEMNHDDAYLSKEEASSSTSVSSSEPTFAEKIYESNSVKKELSVAGREDEPKISFDFLEENDEEKEPLEESDKVALIKINTQYKKIIKVLNTSSSMRVRLTKAFTLPREEREMFTAHIPKEGLLINPDQEIEVEIYCNRDAFEEGTVSIQGRWLMFDFEAETITDPTVPWVPSEKVQEQITAVLNSFNPVDLDRLLADHNLSTTPYPSNKESPHQPNSTLIEKVKSLLYRKLAENGGGVTSNKSNDPVLDAILAQVSALIALNPSPLSYQDMPKKSYFSIGRRCVVVSLCKSALAVSLSAEATKFVPAHLKVLFDTKPYRVVRVTDFEPTEVRELLSKIKAYPTEEKKVVDLFEQLASASEKMLALYQSSKNRGSSSSVNTEINSLYERVKKLETKILSHVKKQAVSMLGNIVRELASTYMPRKQAKGSKIKQNKKQQRYALSMFSAGFSNKALLQNKYFRHLSELSTMLILEDYHTSLENKSFDLFNQRLTVIKFRMPTADGRFEIGCMTKVKVPGANEQRPSVRYGDIFRFRLCETNEEVQGRVLSIKEDMVTVRLPTEEALSSLNPQWKQLMLQSQLAAGKREAAAGRKAAATNESDSYDYDKGGSGRAIGGKSNKEEIIIRSHIRMQPSRAAFSLMHKTIETFLISYATEKKAHENLLFPSFLADLAKSSSSFAPSASPTASVSATSTTSNASLSMAPPPGFASVAPPSGIPQPPTSTSKPMAVVHSNDEFPPLKAPTCLSTTDKPTLSYAAVVSPQKSWVAINHKLNESQKSAIDKILFKNPYKGPHLVFGPPGTGKTMTLVETVLQLLKRNETEATTGGAAVLTHKKRAVQFTRILLCAPSEAAANVICSQLAPHLSPSKMHRLGWWQTSLASFPPALLKYTSSTDGVLTPNCPPPKPSDWDLGFEVVVSSCAGSGQLALLGWTPGKFTHIIIDESCQALEPEVMIPLSLAADRTTVVLCGDPKQLGASLRSKLARQCGYGLSLQERLMNYSDDLPDGINSTAGGGASDIKEREDSKHMTKKAQKQKRMAHSMRRMLDSGYCSLLDANYRSHGDILALPSKLFYENRLIESADKEYTHSMLKWEKLPSQQPVLFYGVHGKSMAEIDSPSYFNMIEANHILDLIKSLIQSTSVSVGAGEIAVIAAFRQQVLRLRKLLRLNGLGSINVGQVEDFQGAECKVIILSTVIAGYDLIGRLRGHYAHTYDDNGEIYDPDDEDNKNGASGGGEEEEEEEEEERSPLGLLFSPKRFNVAMTRARALVIAVGCPDALLEDTLWYKFLKKCAKERSWYGVSCPYLGIGLNGTKEEDGTDASGLLDHISRLSLLGDGASESIYPTELSSMYDQESQWRLIL